MKKENKEWRCAECGTMDPLDFDTEEYCFECSDKDATSAIVEQSGTCPHCRRTYSHCYGNYKRHVRTCRNA